MYNVKWYYTGQYRITLIEVLSWWIMFLKILVNRKGKHVRLQLGVSIAGIHRT